jgi:hypothetical protein
MRSLLRELLRTAIVAAGLGLLLTYIRGWQLGVLIVVLLALYFWPRRDPAARRDRRIENQATVLATAIEDWGEIVRRATEKLYPRDEHLPSAVTPREREQ